MKHFTLLILFFSLFTFSQQPATSPEMVNSALQQKEDAIKNSIVKNVEFENIGPSIMSGRVTDLAVNPDNPTEFYVAYASGGVWHTVNNGTTFEPILDSSPTQNVGDIAVDWKSKVIWVGTGENNSSRSSYAGIGILKSTDNGKSWQNMGLTDSHHIGRILINPNNADELVVGVTGHLYSPNRERGIYRTTDGGKTWTQTLFVNETTGIIDVQYAPNNFNIMFASSWDKDRKAWNFDGDGDNSAIYKSTDAGKTWTKVSTETSGFPTGSGVGRIGLAIFDENTIYAIHDNQFRRPDDEKDKSDDLEKDVFKNMTVETFLKLDDKRLEKYLKDNGFDEEYKAENIKEMVKSRKIKPEDLALYLEDANTMLFDTPVIGAEVYKSEDGGKTWKKTHDGYIEDLYYSYGYYFGHIYVAPNDKNNIYIYGVPILKSKDGGKNFESISAENVHADHHALWINPENPNHLINGNDGGVNISYDDGKNWIKNNSPAVGQFYTVAIDNETPYNVYGGLQDNGVWVGAHNAREDKGWHQNGKYPWDFIMGGDGMQIEVDNRNSNIVYTGFQFGNYYRLNRETEETTYIQPKHKLGERPFRFNWQTPILLSPHNQDILYLGGNKLMRSMNQGDDWTAISDDLTKGGRKGNVAYGTLTSISESPFQFGLLYAGSDDGLVHVSKDAGANWMNISSTFPKDLWVSRVIASQHTKERVYVSLNGYRWDDFTAYIYRSDDYGQTWKNISTNIPASPVNVIKEDSKNENVLYVGTDNGAYVSFNGGETWEAFSNGLPNVAVHDIAVHERERDLILATHGRSFYKADIEALQDMEFELSRQTITVFNVEKIKHSTQWGQKNYPWSEAYEPSIKIAFYSNSDSNQTIKILSEKNAVLKTMEVKATNGFNYEDYNLTITESGKKALMKENTKLEDIKKADNGNYYLPKGNYKIEIGSATTEFEIE